MTPEQAVSDIVANVPLVRAPKTDYEYVNFGFLALGRLVADLGGSSSYESYVKDQILVPTGVTRMSLAKKDGPLENEVEYYPLGISNGWCIDRFDSFGGWVETPRLVLMERAR